VDKRWPENQTKYTANKSGGTDKDTLKMPTVFRYSELNKNGI